MQPLALNRAIRSGYKPSLIAAFVLDQHGGDVEAAASALEARAKVMDRNRSSIMRYRPAEIHDWVTAWRAAERAARLCREGIPEWASRHYRETELMKLAPSAQ